MFKFVVLSKYQELQSKYSKLQNELTEVKAERNLHENRTKIQERDIDELNRLVKNLRHDAELKHEELQLRLDQVKQSILKESRQRLIESDLKRVEAEAKLNTFMALDTKQERKQLHEALMEALKGLSSNKINVVK